jgi:hypothetical protein
MWPGAVIYAGSSSSLHDAGGLVFCPWPIGSVRCLFDNFFLAGCFAVATSAAVQRISLVGHRILAGEGHATARERPHGSLDKETIVRMSLPAGTQ